MTAQSSPVPSESIYGLRASRASPPDRAGKDDERRRVYGAALAQFDELIEASASVGPASRPLPLFYALSQAGRAVAAAHAPGPWRLRGHGLSAYELDPPLLGISVKRTPGASKDGRSVDSMSGVAAASGSAVFVEAATIEALWTSLPELSDLLAPEPAPNRPPAPLRLVPYTESLATNLFDPAHLHATVVYDGSPDELMAHLAEQFPSTAGVQLFQPFAGQPILPDHTPWGFGFRVWWPVAAAAPTIADHIRLLDRIAPDAGPNEPAVGPGLVFPAAPGFEPRWLRPAIGGVPMSSLLTWWVLLCGLSMLARYEPAGWTQAP